MNGPGCVGKLWLQQGALGQPCVPPAHGELQLEGQESCCPQPRGEQRLRQKGDLPFFLPVLWVCAQGGMLV